MNKKNIEIDLDTLQAFLSDILNYIPPKLKEDYGECICAVKSIRNQLEE